MVEPSAMSRKASVTLELINSYLHLFKFLLWLLQAAYGLIPSNVIQLEQRSDFSHKIKG